MSKPVCVVLGVGPGNGEAFARRFADEGYAVALLARSDDFTKQLARELPEARAWRCDATDPDQLEQVFGAIRGEMGEVEVLVYNAGAGAWGTVEETSVEDFEQAWRVNALGALAASRQVIPAMKKAGAGDIVLVGATASRRGGAKFTAFAAGKAAQRSLGESMARHLGPHGIHVSLLIVDGVIDTPRTREMLPDKPDDFFLQPADIAETVWHVTRQPRSAWSFEVEVRPFKESW